MQFYLCSSDVGHESNPNHFDVENSSCAGLQVNKYRSWSAVANHWLAFKQFYFVDICNHLRYYSGTKSMCCAIRKMTHMQKLYKYAINIK